MTLLNFAIQKSPAPFLPNHYVLMSKFFFPFLDSINKKVRTDSYDVNFHCSQRNKK